jgi:hypothetical protein
MDFGDSDDYLRTAIYVFRYLLPACELQVLGVGLQSTLDVAEEHLILPRQFQAELFIGAEFRTSMTLMMENLKSQNVALDFRSNQRDPSWLALYMPITVRAASLKEKRNDATDLPSGFLYREFDGGLVVESCFPRPYKRGRPFGYCCQTWKTDQQSYDETLFHTLFPFLLSRMLLQELGL